MPAFLFALMAVGLAPVQLKLDLHVTPDGRVRAVARCGMLCRSFDVGVGTISVQWLAGLLRSIGDPRPLAQLPPMIRMHLNVLDVNIACKVGVEDAAVTAVISEAIGFSLRGLCQWLASTCVSMEAKRRPVIHIAVTPVFNRPSFELDASIVLTARLGKFVNIGARFLAGMLMRSINRKTAEHTTGGTRATLQEA